MKADRMTEVVAHHDPVTGTVTYVVWNRATRAAAVIDPLLDYDPRTSRTSHQSLDAIARTLDEHDLQLRWILETHIHADHLSGGALLQRMRGGQLCMGSRIEAVRSSWRGIFPDECRPECAAFDRLLDDGVKLELGEQWITVVHSPGHTPACVTYCIDDMAFVGDALFMPDAGTGRCDFPGGSASELFDSVQKLFNLPSATRLFTGHDYGRPGGGQPAWESTVAEQRRANVHIRDGVAKVDYVELRTARDRTLTPPALMWFAVQVNLRAGRLPEPHENGVAYFKVPVDVESAAR